MTLSLTNSREKQEAIERSATLYATGKFDKRIHALAEAKSQLAREKAKREIANREKPEATPVQ